MTKFNPDNKPSLTYGECLGPAMKITDQADADQYFADYVKFIEAALAREPRTDGKTAAEIAKINLGYYAGYYDGETMERVNRLFSCYHSIFGLKVPTVPEAMAAGAALARS
jgi:hypothetical protein